MSHHLGDRLISLAFVNTTTSTRECEAVMGVLNWVQNRMYRIHQSRRKTEFTAESARLAETSIGLLPTCEPEDIWSTTMLSIGTFGTTKGQSLNSLDGSNDACIVGVEELKKLQEELRLLIGGRRGEATNMPLHLHLERLDRCTSHSQNSGTVKTRSIRKPLTSAFNGFMPRPSFKEPIPEVKLNEIIWGMLHKTALPEKCAFSEPVIRDECDKLVQMPQKVKARMHEERGNWIRTDSEYIVLEI